MPRDLFLAQRFARHESPLTTAVYTHPRRGGDSGFLHRGTMPPVHRLEHRTPDGHNCDIDTSSPGTSVPVQPDKVPEALFRYAFNPRTPQPHARRVNETALHRTPALGAFGLSVRHRSLLGIHLLNYVAAAVVRSSQGDGRATPLSTASKAKPDTRLPPRRRPGRTWATRPARLD